VAISDHQWETVIIRGHQRSSEVLNTFWKSRVTALLNSGSIAFTRQPRDGHPSGGWYLMKTVVRRRQASSEVISSD